MIWFNELFKAHINGVDIDEVYPVDPSCWIDAEPIYRLKVINIKPTNINE